MVERVVKSEQQGGLFLPPGFRFHPTDEELITSYLLKKFLNPSFNPRAMGEVNLNKCEPWDLPSKAKMSGGKEEWFFFCHKDMKYPTGMRTNRATKEGYWKATGKDREIFKKPAAYAAAGHGGRDRELVGMKKTLVFYLGRAPRGSKTDWVMHEFRLAGKYRENATKDEWVVCKVFHKNTAGEDKKKAAVESSVGTPNVSSISVDDDATATGDEFLDSMIDSSMYFNSTASLLPDSTPVNNNAAAAAPYNAAAVTTTTAVVGSFVDLLPNNYGFTFNDTENRNLHQAAIIASSAVPTSSSYSSASWDSLHHAAGHPTTGSSYSYNLHDQALMMARSAPGRVGSPYFAAAGLPGSSSATGISQLNSSLGHGSYAAKNLGA